MCDANLFEGTVGEVTRVLACCVAVASLVAAIVVHVVGWELWAERCADLAFFSFVAAAVSFVRRKPGEGIHSTRPKDGTDL